MDIFVNVL